MAINKRDVLQWKKNRKINTSFDKMIKKNIVDNYKDISPDDIVTYHQKYIIRISDGSMVVSIDVNPAKM